MTKNFFIIFFLLTWQYSYACEESSATFLSGMDNGDGTFTYEIEFCSQFNGTSANPSEVSLNFSFFNGNIQSFEPQAISTNGGSDFLGTIEGTSIRYVFAGGTSSHSQNLWCQTITMTTTSSITMAIVDTNVSEDSPDCEHDLELCGIPSLQAAMACETDGLIDLTTLQDGAFPNGIWSGVGVSGSSFDPIAGTQTLTFTAAGSCTASAMTTVSVTEVQTPNLQIAGICETDGLFDLTTLEDPAFPNGIWSGTGVNGNEFDPSVGSQNLTFTPFGDCTESGGTTIFVEVQTIPNLDVFGPLCEQDAPINLPTNQDGLTGTWSGDGVSDHTFDPMGRTGTITLTFTPDTGECVGSNTTSITIEQSIPVILNGFSPICIDASPINLVTIQNGVTGTWSGNGVTNNIFDPNGLEGINDLTFTPDAGQCAATAMTTIEVAADATYQLDDFEPVCETDDAVALPIIQYGIIGNWSGTGIIDNNLNPNGLSGTINLTFTPDDGQCEAEVMMTTIEVNTAITPNLESFDPVCEIDCCVFLAPVQDGITGTWSGNGVVDNVLDPSGQPGGIDLTFIPDAGQCASGASISIFVSAAVIPTLDVFDPLCEQDAPIVLPLFQDGIIGLWSGPGVNGNTFDPTGLAGIVTLSFIPDAGQCAEEGVIVIEINEGIAISLDNLGSFCNTDAPTNLSLVQDGVSGVWSGIGVTNNTFDPSGLSGNVILTFIPDVIEGCQGETTTVVMVNEAPFAVLSETNLITCNEATQGTILDFSSLPVGGDISGTWVDTDGTGVDLSNLTNVDFDGVALGTYSFTYTTNSATAPCSEQSYELLVLVEPCECPSIATSTPPDICNGDGAILDLSILEVTSESGTWTITDTPAGNNPATLINGIFDATGADPGEYELTFMLDFPPGNGCPESTSISFNVIEAFSTPLVSFNGLCQTDSPFDLVPFSESVTGIWSGPGVNNNEFNPAGLNGLVTLTFTPDAGQCASSNTISFTVNAPITISNINTTCNGDNTFYTLTFEMSGNNPEDYTITGGTGSINGNIFTSDPIASGTDYNFDVTAGGCSPINVNGSRDCGCSTYAGAMDINPLTFCDYETVVATHDNNENLETDDILRFVLHTENGTDLGTIINVYNNPTFDFNEGLMEHGVTYYFSAIAANNLNGGGAIDFADECLSLTQGTPITFRLQNSGCYVLQGQLVEDENSNCLSDMGEVGLANWMIKATGDQVYYTLTEEDGSFSFDVPAGAYEVQVIALNPLWDLCQTSLMSSANSPALADNLEFQAIQSIECAELSVDIGTAFLRRCFSVPYTVRYYNWGTEDATDAYINVTLPPLLSISDSTIPIDQQNGNTYTFNVGDVPIGACETFKIFVYTSCDAAFNQTLCVEAEIFSHDYCLPIDPLWSGASLEVESSCEDDLVTFKIKNTGDAMDAPSHYIVVEDAVMLFSTPEEVELGAGEERILPFTADGSTYTLLVDQVPFHPERTVPVGVVEACGTNINGEFSTGFASQFTEGDEEDYLSVDCQRVIGAYDPNDKVGYPMGYGEDFLIEKGQDLDYRIRFQNTGTDTAFTVIIKDKISPFLNLETLQSGTSSHDYDLKIQQDSLIFTFSNIMLPDSNVNEPGSHGFVKFKINQAPDLALGTLIENEAAIFFDFNEPVITNTTQHRLGERILQVSVQDIKGLDNRIKVYPNPFEESAIFEIENATDDELIFELFDVTGQVVRRDIYRGAVYTFYKKGLGQGLYLFKISEAGKVVGTGRVVVQ